MPSVNAEFSVWAAVAQFFSYAVLAVFAQNVVFARAMGVPRLLKLVEGHKKHVFYFCFPITLVQLLSSPLGWAAHNLFFPWLRGFLPAWLPSASLRPVVYLSCAVLAMGVVWLLLGLLPHRTRDACREQLPLAACNCTVLGTLLVCSNQNYTLLQSVAFGLGSGLGYWFAVQIVREGSRRLRSKNVPTIFKGLPSALIYIGILSLAIYGLLGHGIVL